MLDAARQVGGTKGMPPVFGTAGTPAEERNAPETSARSMPMNRDAWQRTFPSSTALSC